MQANELVINGRTVKLSNLDKVYYPEVGFTKAQVIDYYIRIAPVLLPHIKDRALTLKRYPEGVEGEFFYEKQCPAHRPKWVRTASVWSPGKNKTIDFCVAGDLATLVWAANLADIELHVFLAKCRKPDTPTMVVFDLDPGPGKNLANCANVGLWLRKILGKLGLESFAKVSGGKGLHLHIPLNTPVTFEQTKPFANAVAGMLERNHPNEIVTKMAKNLRQGKVFVDWSQNDHHKTTIGVYSLRAKNRPYVALPVMWSEIERAAKTKRIDGLVFEADDALQRVKKRGDLFEPVLKLRQKLPKLV